MPTQFKHETLREKPDMQTVYTAISKHFFYYRMFISKFVLDKGMVPLNPFMVFDYFLLDTVPRETIRKANNTLVASCDGLWVFGPVSNGVLAEVKIAKNMGKPIKFFSITKPHSITEISKDEAEMEEDVVQFRNEL